MSISGRVITVLQIVAMVALLILVTACGDSNDDSTPLSNLDSELVPPDQEDIVITIGTLTDLTGVSANALQYIDLALMDTVNYYNENNLIPGVELKVIKYDTQYDYSRFIPGYEWLREKGADIIVNFLPPGVPLLKTRANEDQVPVFTMSATVEPEELDGSYVYCVAVAPKYEGYTILDWIAKNDPDFPKDRPARIGGAAYSEAYSNLLFEAAEEYCEAHPELYTWEVDYITDFKFTFDAELDGLKNCDYIFTPAPPMSYVEAYREAGYKAKIIWTEVHSVFTGMFNEEKLDLWDGLDGSYFFLSAGWYNDANDPVVDMINRLLDDSHSEGEAEEIRTAGGSYRTVMRADMICDMIKQTVERGGTQKFDSEALVETANSWSYSYGDVENYCNFTETKRFSQNYYVMFEVIVDESNPHTWQYVTRADPEMIPQVTSP